MKKLIWNVLKYVISLLGLFYAFKGVPLATLWETLKGYPVLPMGGVLLAAFSAYAVMGIRLARMLTPALRFSSTFSATLVCLAVNNILPAKAGEIAKAAWMGRSNNLPLQKMLGLVFMERFFDVNVLALLSLWYLWKIGQQNIVMMFVLFLSTGWIVLYFFKKHPNWMHFCLRILGKGKLKAFAEHVLGAIVEQMTLRRLVWMTIMSFTVWGFYGLQVIIALNGVAGLGLSLSEALSVFAISSLGMLLPSSPGAFGVYEAVAVTALKHHGIAPESALAVALFIHMAQFIPVTLIGGLLFTAFPENREQKDYES